MSRPKTLDHLRGKKKPFVKRVGLILDPDLADRYDAVVAERDEAKDRVRAAETMGTGPVNPSLLRALEDAEARVLALEPEIEEATETFVFRGIGRTAYSNLLDAHRPTQAQIERNAQDGLGAPEYNVDSFVPALVEASCISHEATVDEWKALLGDSERWNSAEEVLLFGAALAANNDARVVDVGKGSAATRS